MFLNYFLKFYFVIQLREIQNVNAENRFEKG